MKIRQVRADARKKEFVIATAKATFAFPYALLPVAPTAADPVVEAGPDADLGCEGFAYRLRSGKTDTVHLDAVLDYNRDPDYVRQQILYRLSLEALELIDRKRISKRGLARRLRTSATQLYRLLDPACSTKTIDQMVRLLHVMGATVEVRTDRTRAA